MTPILINLPQEAYQQAKQFQQRQSLPEQAKIVYHNTLAVYAVNLYIQSLNIETDLQESDSWDKIMQTLLDVADLTLKNGQRIECRYVVSKQTHVYIPPEVWEDRIAYIIVEINQSRKQANLLGFLKTIEQEKVSLKQLEPMENFLVYLKSF
jgi:hypothetical protein